MEVINIVGIKVSATVGLFDDAKLGSSDPPDLDKIDGRLLGILVGVISVGKLVGCLEVGEWVFLMVGRLDDGNAEDGRTVDVDIELGYVVGEYVNDNKGKSDGINELNKDGLEV